MAIDPSIIGSHVPPVERFSPLKAMKEARTYAEDQQKERDEQAKREDEAVVQAIMQQHPEDPDTAIKVMKQRGFTRAAMGFQKLVTDERTAQSKLDTNELTNRASEAQLLKDSIGDGSPASWNMTVSKLRGKSPELDKILSQPYTPELAKQVQNFATTEKERSEAVIRAIQTRAYEDWVEAFRKDPESQETQQAWAFYMGPEEMGKALVAQQNADTARQQADTNRAEELRLGQPKPEEPYTLGPDQRRMLGKEEIARGLPRTFAPQRESTGGSARTLTPNAALQTTRQLRNDYVRETKTATEIERQLSLMKASLEAVNKGSAAAGSQGVLVTFQKIIDPISVVRESEYARSASGLSLLSRLEGQWMKISQGGAGVTPADLKTFVDLAETFAVNQRKFTAETKQQIDSIADEFGLKKELITRDIGEPGTSAAPSGAPKEGDKKPITAPGYPAGAEATFTGGKWLRTK
jgi:hypothetical protein